LDLNLNIARLLELVETLPGTPDLRQMNARKQSPQHTLE
jgi:hypothetical protein